MSTFYAISGVLFLSSVIILQANASSRYATDEVPASNSYAYRVIARELAIHPIQRFSDNMKPFSLREISFLKNGNKTSDFLGDHNTAFVHIDEIENKGLRFSPVHTVSMQNTGSNKTNSFIFSNFGDQFEGKLRTIFSGAGNFYYNQHFVASHETRLNFDKSNADLQLYRFRIKTAFEHLAVSFARESLIVGPGYFGSLLHSNNVEPENTAMIKIEDPYKISYIGYFRFYMWWTAYDDNNRINKDPNLVGLRVSFKPSKYFETNLSRTSFYGGTNNDRVKNLKDILDIATAKDENSESGINTDQLAAIDISFYVPDIKKYTPFRSAKIYSERVWNDLKAIWQSDDEQDGVLFKLLGTSMLHGVFLTTGKLDFHLEYVKTTNALYRHASFGQDGYTDNGYLIGHFVGPDAKAYLSELYYEATNKIHIFGQLGYFERGVSLEHSQFTKQYGLGINYFFANNLQLGFNLKYFNANRTDTDDSAIIYKFSEKDYREVQGNLRLSYAL